MRSLLLPLTPTATSLNQILTGVMLVLVVRSVIVVLGNRLSTPKMAGAGPADDGKLRRPTVSRSDPARGDYHRGSVGWKAGEESRPATGRGRDRGGGEAGGLGARGPCCRGGGG